MDWTKIENECAYEVDNMHNLPNAKLWPNGTVFRVKSTGKYYEKASYDGKNWYMERNPWSDKFWGHNTINPPLESYRMIFLDTTKKSSSTDPDK